MPDLLLNEATGDIIIDQGDAQLSTGLNAVAQRVRTRLQIIREEWFLELSIGVDYINVVFVKNPNMVLVQSVIVAEINKTIVGEAVLKDFQMVLENSTRLLTVQFTLRDIVTQEEIDQQLLVKL